MKGLLLKDFYMARTYCKSYVLLALIFLGVSLAGGENLYFIFYPALFFGMIPMSLLSYDERSHWLQYAETMPYTRVQIVSAKYLVGLIAQTCYVILVGIVQGIKLGTRGTLDVVGLLEMLLVLLSLSTMITSVCMPFMFKWGVEKGRMAYYVMVGVACAVAYSATTVSGSVMTESLTGSAFPVLICVVSMSVYALSWFLSAVFYTKRELK